MRNIASGANTVLPVKRNSDISVLYNADSCILVNMGKWDISGQNLVGTKFYMLDKSTDALLDSPIASKLKVEMTISGQTGEPFSRVVDCGDGRFMIDSLNIVIIDTKLGKEIYHGDKYFKDSIEMIEWEMRQNNLYRKNFPTIILKGDIVTAFLQDGNYFAYDIINRKYQQKGKTGAPLVSLKTIGDNYWLVCADFYHLALTIVDKSTYADQKATIKPIMVNDWDISDGGLLYSVDSKLSWVKADLSQGSVDLAKPLRNKTIRKALLSADGSYAWVITEDTIAKLDLASGSITKANSLKFDKPEDANSIILWDHGASLFVSRSPKYSEKTVPLQAYDANTQTLVWTTQVVPTAFAFMDKAKVVVVSKPNGIEALPYPASE